MLHDLKLCSFSRFVSPRPAEKSSATQLVTITEVPVAAILQRGFQRHLKENKQHLCFFPKWFLNVSKYLSQLYIAMFSQHMSGYGIERLQRTTSKSNQLKDWRKNWAPKMHPCAAEVGPKLSLGCWSGHGKSTTDWSLKRSITKKWRMIHEWCHSFNIFQPWTSQVHYPEHSGYILENPWKSTLYINFKMKLARVSSPVVRLCQS